METVAGMLRVICTVASFSGMCLGVAQLIRSGFLFVTARGNAEQIDDAKDIFWRSIQGTAMIVGGWIIFLR